MPYRYLEDDAIADVALEAWGSDLPEVFRAAADAVTNAMVDDLESVRAREEVHVELEDESLDLLLFNFLQRLVYEKDAWMRLLRVPDVTVDEERGRWRLRARAQGERLDPRRHHQRVDVKAVTLHRFRLDRDPDGWRAFVILDI